MIDMPGSPGSNPYLLIPQSQMSVHYYDSAQPGDDSAPENVLDGDGSTIWYTVRGAGDPHPHEIQLDLGAEYIVGALKYLPRQDQSNGRIAEYEIYVSLDDTDWGEPVAIGTWSNSPVSQVAIFPAKGGRYVRLRALSEVNGGPRTSIAELNILQAPEIEAFISVSPGPAHTNPPLVRVLPPWQDAGYLFEFGAYGALHYGANVACGDVNNDSTDEILTGAGPGDIYGPHVRGFGVSGTPLPGLSFLAYGTNHWGVNVAAGDIDGDAFDEIITGAGPGAVFGPHVRGWNYDGTPGVEPISEVSYFAYGTPKWGVNVSAGDIDGDGYDEIVTGAGPGAVYGPHVRGWNVDGGKAEAMPGVSFLAYGTNKYGVNVTCGDVDSDGIDEIVTGAGPGSVFGAHVRSWNYDGVSLTAISGINFFAWPPGGVSYGAKVFAGADLDGDERDELIVSPGPDPSMATPVKVFTFDGSQVTEWFSFEAFTGLTHGTNVAAGRF
jgi:hypothetical protein